MSCTDAPVKFVYRHVTPLEKNDRGKMTYEMTMVFEMNETMTVDFMEGAIPDMYRPAQKIRSELTHWHARDGILIVYLYSL